MDSPAGESEERNGLGTERPTDEFHSRFLGHPATLVTIAFMAAGDDILPGGESAERPWYHVIQIQFLTRQLMAAILTGVIVAK